MSQNLVIRLIPLEIFVLSLLAGWLGIGAVRALVGAEAPLVAAAATAVAVVEGQAPVARAAGAGAAAAILAPLFTPEVQRWQPRIAAWAAALQLDPNLIATVMQIESCGAPQVVSGSGAQGLFQVMPYHFVEGEDTLDPDTNAARGLGYLALGLQRAGGNAGLALAGYNGGHSQIGRESSLWPAETQRYWYWGTGIYADAAAGQPSSSRLQEWLDAGGASLCATAAGQPGP